MHEMCDPAKNVIHFFVCLFVRKKTHIISRGFGGSNTNNVNLNANSTIFIVHIQQKKMLILYCAQQY